MGSRSWSGQQRGNSNMKQRWCAVQPLTPLMEGPDPDMQEQQYEAAADNNNSKLEKESSSSNNVISNWEIIREWFRTDASSKYHNKHHVISPELNVGVGRKKQLKSAKSTQDLRLLLGVLGCPLAPIPIPPPPNHHLPNYEDDEENHPSRVLGAVRRVHIKDNIPIEKSMARYIIQQYLAATGCSRGSKRRMMNDNMYVAGSVKMIRCETEVSSGKGVKCLGGKSAVEEGCFVLWQMLHPCSSPPMWSLELAVGQLGSASAKGGCPRRSYKHHVVAGSDGNTVWRHTPWLGTHAAKGPQRPLRRIIQGLNPKSTGRVFAGAEWVGEQRIGEDDCFVLKVAAERAAVAERSEGPAEVLRHVLYGYFSQKSGLLVYLEDSHLTRVAVTGANYCCTHRRINDDEMEVEVEEERYVYWETTIGSRIGDYREVEGVMIAHEGRSVATVFRFEEQSVQHSRTRMEELWRIDDVVFNVPGLSRDHFIPPSDIFQSP
ncbi:unnamed protein product [Linum trigynum]|uniref:Uncharacterized protein n=1 Tax=Linum trigynum TaxID=586398 RepID=A0AAV2GFV8_9ROSI